MSKVTGFGWRIGALVAWIFLSAPGYTQVADAQAELTPTAHEVVRVVTQSVMKVVARAPEYVDEDPDRYYQAVHEILDPVIDFRGFARSIMGPYASGDRYRSLDSAGRQKLRDQLERFTDVMRHGLVTTYGKGLLAFGGSRIEVDKPSAGVVGETRVSVRQLIYSEDTQPYIVMYQMGLNKEKVWKLRNVIIESVNLGEIYKNQFQASARKHNGDLDVVIDNWASVDIES